MSELRTMEIEGKEATVAFLSEVGGVLVEPEEATFVIARFEDGSHAYYVVDKDADAQS